MLSNKPKNRQDWILDLLRTMGISYGDCFKKYKVEFKKSDVTFGKDWAKAKEEYCAYNEKLNKAKEIAGIESQVRLIKKGLKTKEERVMFYQVQIDIMESQLNGESKFMFMVANKPIPSHNTKGDFILPIEKQEILRRQIREYQSEIHKIQGDYAAIWNKLDIKSDNDVNVRVGDLPKISKQKLIEIVQANRKV